jgi:NAD(P)-dependent dehydrogenase (short-subunit alcohol dehydrogenase family)/acyl carrier protein
MPEPAPIARQEIADRLVAIVQERTGYPTEMLKLDLDLEADLGIDSIKRVEILGKLRDTVPALDQFSDSRAMDALSRARTLGAIVDQLVSLNGCASPSENGRHGPTEPAVEARSTPVPSSVQRFVLESADAPLPVIPSPLVPGGVVLLTDDGRGVARQLAARLEAAGHRVLGVTPEDRTDWTSPDSVAALLDRIRNMGALTGVVHLLPLRETTPVGLDRTAWSARMEPELKGLFLLARAAAADLERAAKLGGSCLIAATALGGSYASLDRGREDLDFFPGRGGIAGLTKTLAREWPQVRVRVVDVDPREPGDVLADRFAAEVFASDGWPEVGYHHGRRIRLKTREVLFRPGSNGVSLQPREPVLVTGGARGITAAVTVELARLWKPTLLLVGTSPLPTDAEADGFAGLEHPAELKAAIHARLRRDGEDVSPTQVEQSYQALRRAREIRANLLAMREAGAVVHYAQADVRDAEGLAHCLESWRAQVGEPVGLIHGAGLIQDKLLCDKAPEAFDRVLSTKVVGALNLVRLLRPEPLRFAALFSSVAGRFGNLGQSDYAAANEVLNKLALWLDRRWPGRVVSVLWGPWSGLGMVSDLKDHLQRQGMHLIPPEVGPARFLDELRFGTKGDVEVILSGALGTLEEPIRRDRLTNLAEAGS